MGEQSEAVATRSAVLYLTVTVAEYMNLHEEIVGMMQVFYNQIDNAAITAAYRV